MQLPDSVEKIIHTLEAAGYEAYAVGGCVRDALLGLTPDDWDITTSAEPEEVKALFSRTIDTGIKHGTVTVRLNGKSFEVTTYRIDGKYEDGRHPEEVTFTKSLEEDLKRRDFTINAMAVNDRTGIVDLFGGQEDLKAGIIRCVGDPMERFSEDALRMMRAVRFAAKLDFSIEEETKKSISILKDNLRKVSAERIQVELTKLITSNHPEMMRTLYETGLTSVFFPEWDVAMVCEQNTKHHCFTVGEHTIEVMKHVRNDKIMRLAALLHDIGKPGMKRTDKKGHDHFQGHPQLSDVMADNILRRLKYDNDTIKKVCMLVRYHDERPALNPRSIRRCMREMNLDFDDLFELKRADIAGQSDYMHEEKLAAVDKFEKLYHENLESGNCTDKKQLAVNGGDLIKAGVDKGPEMGRVMEKLLDDVIDEPSANTKETLLSRAKKYSKLAKKGKLLLSIFAVIFCISMGLTACADNRGTVSYRAPGTPLDASGDASADAKDSLDKVYIIEENNRDEGKLTVMNITSLREFRYPYNVSTEFLDKYGDTDSVEDFKPGMAITFDASGRYGMLTTVKKSNAVWEWDDLKNFSFDESISAMQFGGENYRYTDSTLFLDGNNLMERKDLIGGVDEVMVVGVDKEVLAVALTKGHGYLQLDDTKRFDNSLIQIGSYDAALVSSGKTFTVPVGTYAVTIANNGWGGTKNVKIKKNVTSVLNLESMKGKGPKSCRLKFEIDVDGAKIYLDGKRVKTDKTMTVLYGAHSLKVTADGYDDWERTLYVNSPTAVISLDISDSKQGSSNNSTATTNNSGTTNSSTNSSTTNDTNGSTVTTGNGSTTTTSSGTTQKERDKAQENYLSTLADSVVNTLGSLSSD
ncbi:MAG: CCA tRNA nucleotidyltransferase [Lachnospiraceae bacterium]|nr:CCA tRNA nucleotidyltransferase [Lachnospiraceae bacterium]